MSKSMYNLTNPQKSIWLTEQTFENSNVSTICGTIFFKENVDIKLLKETVNIFVQKNDALRTRILVEAGEPKQFISDIISYEAEAFELNTLEELKELEANVAKTSFNLLDSNLFMFKVFKLKDGTGGIIGHLHHLISDAWSFGIMSKQLKDIYEKLLSNEDFEANPSYVEYIEKETEYLSSDKYIKDKEYWETRFAEVPDLASIKQYQNDNSSTKANRYKAELNLELCEIINTYAKENRTSSYSFLISIYSLYLSRVSGIDNVVIGTPFLNRSNFKEKNTMGMFVNTLPNMLDIDWNLKFSEFVKYTTEQQRNMFRHSKYPYDKLLEKVRREQDINRNLYDIAMSYQNARNDSQESNINYCTYWNFNGNIPESMQIHVYDMDNTGALQIFYDYQTDKFLEEEIKEIHNRILYIIKQVLQNDIALKDIQIVTESEKQKLLYEFNDTKTEYPREKTIAQVFEEQVELNPDKIAIVFDDNKLTYREFNEKANKLARHLKYKGVQPQDKVVLLTDKSIDLYVSIMAILKLGALYVPVDSEYPEERIKIILEDCKPKVVIADEKYENLVKNENTCTIPLQNLDQYENTNLENTITARARSLYYIYFWLNRKT
ncbi:MAG: AMP-binding protein [Clostridia bacterium]|nr:AMP-binding protein [Clostridia bacterium]